MFAIFWKETKKYYSPVEKGNKLGWLTIIHRELLFK